VEIFTGNDSPPPLPKIAGMPLQYLIASLKSYPKVAHQHKQMTPLMSKRTDEEIELLAKYYSAKYLIIV
jgi:cytochrome c553